MSRVSRPSNKVMVFDPSNGGKTVEAATTDLDEMERRKRAKSAESKAAKSKAK